MLIIAGGVCFFAGVFLDHFEMSLAKRRRIYWYLALLAATLVFLAGYPDLGMMLGFLAMWLMLEVGWAYAHTPYIRINGKIYAFKSIHADAESERNSIELQRHEQFTTPTKAWWLIAGWPLAICVAMCSSFLPGREGFSFQHDREWILYMVGFCLLFGIGIGYGEAKFRYPIAQGQRLQFIIASVSSVGLFAVFYLSAYRLTSLASRRRGD